jgi:hypothetical protein
VIYSGSNFAAFVVNAWQAVEKFCRAVVTGRKRHPRRIFAIVTVVQKIME